jgi:uracil-DNA glycosylase family 4
MTLDDLNSTIIACAMCPRLVEWREKVAREKRRAYQDQEYWGRPVPGFGDPHASVFVVGLAPGAHGSNRTGRQFTGDSSGDFLYPALYRAGFASRPYSISRIDGLELLDLYTAPVCRCVPPGNHPTADEMANCQPYMLEEIEIIQPKIFVSLGRIAYDAVLRMFELPKKDFNFFHGSVDRLPGGCYLIGSYHPSRQNTQTGRLTQEMFDRAWNMARDLLLKQS